MRCLNRNKQKFYYANYQGMSKIYSDGKFTGEYQLTYSEPTLAYGNISPARGDAYTSPFGITDTGIDKVIVLSNPAFPITETSVLWIDNAGLLSSNSEAIVGQALVGQAVVGAGSPAYDYTVVRIARSLNSISIAIKKVDVTNA